MLALPAGLFARRHGYRGGLLCGLSVIVVGCLCFVPVTRMVATQAVVFSVFLLALGLVACGFTFMSIMYPTHFALAIHGLGERTKLASSWMVTAIVGGALVPMSMGWVADRYSTRVGFRVPLACFACIMAYGFGWPWLFRRETAPLSRTPEIS